ncbi:methyl-accepting chemotaxis protein [Kiloniella sp. b19]|uniref:methyl-accepting chemotaxis protein n=1 Tax=Kiloniella sp. GXU_MW_B19 TaxID=3141326 RepID=UPI0031D8B9AB
MRMTKESIREKNIRSLLIYLAVHVPVVWIASQFAGNATLGATGVAVVFAAVPGLVWKMKANSELVSYLIAVSLMMLVSLLVYSFRGHEWQIDMHMYFFAAMAILSSLLNWQVFVIATAVVAVHHLGLALFVPAWVFPADDSQIARVLLHAVILVIEAAVLLLAARKMVESLDEADTAIEQANASAREVEAAAARQRDMEVQAGQDRKAELEEVASTFEREVGQIVEAVTQAVAQLQATAESMSGSARGVEDSSNDATSAADSISRNVDAVASASEEMTASVGEIARQVSQATSESEAAADLSTEASGKVDSLSGLVNEISDVVGLITDIAEQTNLLALNATIEAARAGDAGKGFAVVASEVKGLASQTASATERITAQISAVVGATDDTVEAIARINSSITEVKQSSVAISAAIEEQEAATQEIAGNASRTAQDVVQVSGSIRNVRELAETNAGYSQGVVSASGNLQQLSDDLCAKLDVFLGRLRAG